MARRVLFSRLSVIEHRAYFSHTTRTFLLPRRAATNMLSTEKPAPIGAIPQGLTTPSLTCNFATQKQQKQPESSIEQQYEVSQSAWSACTHAFFPLALIYNNKCVGLLQDAAACLFYAIQHFYL